MVPDREQPNVLSEDRFTGNTSAGMIAPGATVADWNPTHNA